MEKAKRMKMTEETPASSSAEGVVDDLAEISTGRVELSRINADFLMKWAADDDEVSRFCTWDSQTSRDQAIASLKDETIPHPLFQAICIKQKVIIGLISVTPYSGYHDKCRAELGYCLAKNYLAIGIVKTVLKMVISTVFQQWPDLERLDAKVEVDDNASQSTLERTGFQREGVLRKYRRLNGRTVDVAMYSLLPSDLQLVLSL